MIRKVILLLLILASIAGVIWGITGIYQIFAKGHGAVTNTTTDVPWGIQISAYIFLVLVGTGCTFVNLFGHIANPKTYAIIAQRVIALALLTALGGLLALFFELGWITRMPNFIVSPNLSSPMWWMGLFTSLYVISVAVEFVLFKVAPKSVVTKIMIWLALIFAVATYTTLGSIFGITEARPYYYGALVPVSFLAVSFLCGAALSALVSYISGTKYHSALQLLRKMVGWGMGLVFVFSVWRYITGITSGADGYEIFGMTASKFWNTDILLGLAIPFVLVLASSIKGLGWLLPISGAIVLVTQYASRYGFVVDGFQIPQFKSVWTPEVITYTPSSVEISIVAGAFAFVIFLYSIGEFTGILESPHMKEEV